MAYREKLVYFTKSEIQLRNQFLESFFDIRLTLSTTVGASVTAPADTSIRHASPVNTGPSVQAGTASTRVRWRGSRHGDYEKTVQFNHRSLLYWIYHMEMISNTS